MTSLYYNILIYFEEIS